MKKASYCYSIVVGFCMVTMWSMLLVTNQVAEIHTEPIRIISHIASELITAILLIVGGFISIRKVKWGLRVHTLSLGMLFYSVMTAGGYYMQLRDYAMSTMFICLTIATILFFTMSLKHSN